MHKDIEVVQYISSQSQMLLSFVQAYGRELSEAYEWCNKYRHSRKEAELHQAWDLYYHVFKHINKQLPSLTVLEVQYVAPALVRAQVSPCPYCLFFPSSSSCSSSSASSSAFASASAASSSSACLTVLEMQYVDPALVRAQLSPSVNFNGFQTIYVRHYCL